MSESNLSLRLLKSKTQYLDVFAGHKQINPYQSHIEEPRRVVSMFVPDDGPNGFALPGIRPGSRFKMALRTKVILG